MVMAAGTMDTEIQKFLVADPGGGADPNVDPTLGYPDTPQDEPPTEGTTSSPSGDGSSIVTSGLTPSAFVGGYLSAPPYWDGVEITANTATSVTAAEQASDPAGPQVDSQTAPADDAVVYTIVGTPNIAKINEVLLRGTELLAVNPGGSTDLANGIVEVYNPDTPDEVKSGDTVKFTYVEAVSAVPSGIDYSLTEPATDPGGGNTVGDRWSAAYSALIAQGAANGVSPADLSAAETAMKDTVNGMMGAAVPGLGVIAMASGVAAFWGAIVANFATVFPASLGVIPPPAIAGLAAALTAATAPFAALPAPTPWNNIDSKAASAAMAGAFLTGSLGGLVIFQPGPVPTPFPFL